MTGDELQPAGRAAQRLQGRDGARRIAAGGEHETERRPARWRPGSRRPAAARSRDAAQHVDDSRWPAGAASSRQQPELAAPARRRTRNGRRGARRSRRARAADRVGVQHRGAARRQQAVEQPRLGREVDVHGAVVVEMVLGQVGEAGRGESHAVEPALVEAVARGLHRQMVDALARQGRQILVKRHRVGRGQAGVARQARRDDAERAEAGGLAARASPDLAQKCDARSCRWCR